MVNKVTGHTVHHACISQQIGGVTLCRRGTAVIHLTDADDVLHRAPRAGCLTGLRAGTPVTRSVYADSFVHRNIAPHSFPLTTLCNQRTV